MRRTVLPLGVVALLTFAACSDAPEPLAPADPSANLVQPAFGIAQEVERVMAGRVLARLTDGADPAAVGRGYGLEVERERPGYVMFRGAANGSERALAARMGGDAQIVWAEPDYLRQTTDVDPSLLWAFNNPGGMEIYYTRGRNSGKPVTSLLSRADADEDADAGIGSGGVGVSIASIDTGVDFGHAEFQGGAHLVAGWDYYSDDADPTDENGHGTHTTGTMVGVNVGVAGVTGAASNVTVYVFRVCGAVGCPTSAIVDAIRAATDSGVVAMNLSLGGSSLAQSEADAIQYATDHGALVIASAGNDGTSTVSCPACDDNAISVAASDWLDEHAYYTNWGSGLDITAPGGEMYSNTTEEAGIYSSVPGGYAYYQGTSMAAPQVTGTAAVVASVTGLAGSDLRTRILGTTDDLGSSGYDTQFGWGRLNTYNAVNGNTNGGGNDGGGTVDPPPSEGLNASFAYACLQSTCSFDASSSTGASSYQWDFGDGNTGSGVTTTHAFGGEGDFTVRLTVGDGPDTADTSRIIQCTTRGPNLRCK
jgi:serine protease